MKTHMRGSHVNPTFQPFVTQMTELLTQRAPSHVARSQYPDDPTLATPYSLAQSWAYAVNCSVILSGPYKPLSLLMGESDPPLPAPHSLSHALSLSQ